MYFYYLTNKEISEWDKIISEVKQSRWRWLGHVLCMDGFAKQTASEKRRSADHWAPGEELWKKKLSWLGRSGMNCYFRLKVFPLFKVYKPGVYVPMCKKRKVMYLREKENR